MHCKKKVYLKILQALQKNTCVVVTPTQVFSCDVCEILRKLTLKNICERLFHRFVGTRLLSSWTSLLLEWKSDSKGWVKTIFEKCLIMTFSHNFFTLLIPLYIFNICFPFFWKAILKISITYLSHLSVKTTSLLEHIWLLRAAM